MLERIVKCLEENGIQVDSKGNLLDLDSIKFISFVITLEDEFTIEFPDAYLNRLSDVTVYDICDIISELTTNRS